jgi:hypothetical protein
MKGLVILIFVFFSFFSSAKEVVFKVTKFNGIKLTKGQLIRVAPIYSDSNVNFGQLQFLNGDSSFNVNFFVKKNLTDFLLFLKLNENYELYWLKFVEKTGKYILTNNIVSIELQLSISSDNYITPIQIEIKNSLEYLNSIFSINNNLLFFFIEPILSSTIEPSIFDHLDIQEEGYLILNKETNTIDVYSKIHVIKKTIKCNSIVDGEKIIIDCNYKNINETIGIIDTILETSKSIRTNVIKIIKPFKPIKFIFKSVDSTFFVHLSKDIRSPEIMLIEPKLSRDLVLKPKSRNIQVRGIITDDSKIIFTTINEQEVELSGKFFSKTLSSDKSPFYVKIKSIDEYGNIGIREFEVELPTEEPIKQIEELSNNLDNVGNYFALIIGINDYQDKRIPQLDNPIKDAKTLKNTLVQKYTFENNNVIYLENANRKSIFKALVEIKSLIGKNDNLLLFYAGHGFFDKEMDSGYWLPSDSEKDNKSEWISFDDVIHHLRAINSKHTLVISDACFSGGFLKERSVTLSDKAMTDLYQVPSRKVITSGNLTTVPDESVFMKYLVRTLNDNQESYLTEEMLFDKIKIPVVNNSDTTPLIGVLSKTGDEGGNFIFIKR